MIFTPVLNQEPFHFVILSTEVASIPAGPAELCHSPLKNGGNCFSSFIRATLEVYDEPGMAIYPPVNPKSPGTQFFVPVFMPQSVGTTNAVDTLLYYSRPSG
jgi:hypothetical protein